MKIVLTENPLQQGLKPNMFKQEAIRKNGLNGKSTTTRIETSSSNIALTVQNES